MFSRRGSVEAILADYRSTEYETALRGPGERLHMPVLALWGDRGPTAGAPVVEAWRQAADEVRGEPVVDSAHYVHEEQPEFVAQRILTFADEFGL
jgi:pimeloyl-ACP methyl ester carboxylesterase